MSTLDDDLQAAQAQNSPSVAAAVAAAIDKEQPQAEQPVQEVLPEENESEEDTTGT